MRLCLFVSLLSTACCGFSHVGNDGDGGGGDPVDMADNGGDGDGGAGSGGGGGGGSGGGGGGTSMCTGCGCGAPVLLVAVQSVDGSQTNDGRVLQLSVPPSGPAVACGPTLNAAHSLSKTPTAVGWVPPDGVLFGSSESTLFLDGTTDQIRTTYRPTQVGDIPRALFTLTRAGMPDVIAVGLDTTGDGDITVLKMVDPKNGAELKSWDVSSTTVADPPRLVGGSRWRATRSTPRASPTSTTAARRTR